MKKKENFAIVSKILGPFGLKGEAKCSIETDIIENITKQKSFFLRRGERRIQMDVEYIKLQHNCVIIKFKGIDTPEAVKFFRGWFLEVPYSELVPLGEGEFYWFELIGMEVYSTEGEFIGIVEDIMATGPYDLYVVRKENREVMIPSIMAKSIDKKEKKIIVELIEGLI